MPRRDRDNDDDYDREADDERKDAASPKKNDPLDILLLVFVIMGAVGAFLSFQRPAANTAHLLFRLGIAGVSLVGIIVVLVLKMLRKRDD
jgi:uncharacterized membrane protein YsdA (DUF1294 family)